VSGSITAASVSADAADVPQIFMEDTTGADSIYLVANAGVLEIGPSSGAGNGVVTIDSDTGDLHVTGINSQGGQDLAASAYADEDITIGSNVTSSYVRVTIDDDSTDETIDLQDGTKDGQMVIFIVVAGADNTDDSFIIEADDTTFGNTTDVELNDVGETASFIWDATNSKWWLTGNFTIAD